MKGISPLIAAVLLIAFTVAVGGIVSVFFTSFTKQTTGSVSSQGGQLVSCAGVSPTVDSVLYPVSGTGYVNATFTNPGSLNITNVTVYVAMPNGSTFTMQYGLLGGSMYLNPLSSNQTQTLVTPSGGVSPSEVRVTGFCNGVQAVAGSCLAGQSCMKGI